VKQNNRASGKADASKYKVSPFQKKLLDWGKRKSVRDGEKGIFLEGEKLIDEAIQAGHPLSAVWMTEAIASKRTDLLKKFDDGQTRLFPVSPTMMKKSISGMDTPPGIAAVAPQPSFIYRQPGDPFSLIVAIPLIQSPGNLGGIIRTANYFGADEVWLGKGSSDPYTGKVLRGSMGAAFSMPIIKTDNISERLTNFQSEGASVWAAVAHSENAKVTIDGEGSRILMLGGESRGLAKAYEELADYNIQIPGAGRGESLNLMVAAGILIHAATVGRWVADD
jgi:TrmH family RNA methyltransferase